MWLLEGRPAVPRLVLEAAGVSTDPPPPGGRFWPAAASLFWYLPQDARLDLEKPKTRDFVLEQVLVRGTDDDIVRLMRTLTPREFAESYRRVRDRLPEEVRRVWDDILEQARAAFDLEEQKTGG